MTTRSSAAASRAAAPPLPVGEALSALVASRCRIISQGLARKSDRHGGVHRARKAIRSLRGILALAGDVLGDQAKPIDRSLQQLARGLSALRDAHVAIGVAQSLATGDDTSAWWEVTARLHDRSERLLAEALARDPEFAARRARLGKLAQALAALPWHKVKRKALLDALAKSERRVAAAERKAKAQSTAPRLHRWRRRVRRLRMQVDALGRIGVGPEKAGKVARELKKRTDRLGRRQDLEVLAGLLPQVSDASDRPALRRRLRQEVASLDCMR